MDALKEIFRGRPLWMNGVFVFCAYMTFIYMPFDFFWKPVAEDEEIWFGYMLHGWAAKATEPIHWAIYGAGFYGFLKMKSWMHPWAALYVFQVAIAMAVFPWLYVDGSLGGLIVAIPFVILGVALWQKKTMFQRPATESEVPIQAETDQQEEGKGSTNG